MCYHIYPYFFNYILGYMIKIIQIFCSIFYFKLIRYNDRFEVPKNLRF